MNSTKPIPKSNIFITAAHLSEEAVGEPYKLLYKDVEKDTAYYLDTSIKLPKVPLSSVTINGISSAKVITSEEGSFLVEVDYPEQIVAGLSGTRVFNKSGKAVGFVSSMQSGGLLKCIALPE